MHVDERCDPTGTIGETYAQGAASTPHVIDGAFTGDEWANAQRLEGRYTDVYLDVHDGRLFLLNDWRVNEEGIRPDCRNYFRVGVGGEMIELSVYGDGRVEVLRDGEPFEQVAEGAYGFGPSPAAPKAHTIYEFSLAVATDEISVCCYDPVTELECDELTREPMTVHIRATADGALVTRAVDLHVPRLGEGAACGSQQGVCASGLECRAGECIPGPEPIVIDPV